MSEPTPLNYKAELSKAMDMLSADPGARFIGYGVKRGRAMGTMKGVAESQLIETPVAENLMVGLGTGLALRGLKPLVFIERCDFLTNSMDALVNHLDKISLISRGEFNPTAIIRVVVGNRTKGLQTGVTHTQDFSIAMTHMLTTTKVVRLETADQIVPAYTQAIADLGKCSTVLFEYKDNL